MRVDVLRDPASSNDVLTHLMAGTAIEVLAVSPNWLTIRLPAGAQGYVATTNVRLATYEEQQAFAQRRATGKVAPGQPAIRTMQEGIKTSARPRSPRRSAAAGLVALSFVLCASGAFLAGGIEEQECTTFEFGGTSCQTIGHPFQTIGGILIALGFVALIVAVIVGVGAIIRASRSS